MDENHQVIIDSSKTENCVKLETFTIPCNPSVRKLGTGTGVNVFAFDRFSPTRGKYGSPWAVKKLNRNNFNSSDSKELRPYLETKKKLLGKEAAVLKSLEHPNIIGYRGSTKCEASICLIMESGEQSLADLIEERQDAEMGPFPPETILKVAESVASALLYLHNDAHLLHGDIRSSNVLIKGEFEFVKLCDFEEVLKLDDDLNVIISDSVEEGFYTGSECWAPPEAIKKDIISHKSDIFCFGLMIWEMISLSTPHLDKLLGDSQWEDLGEETEELGLSELVETECEEHLTEEELEQKNEEEYKNSLGTRPELPPSASLDNEYKEILKLYLACTETDPNKRPSAKEILDSYFK